MANLTPTNKKRYLRSNSQNDLTIDSIKNLIEKSNKELLTSLKMEFDSLRETISSLSTRVEKLEEDNRNLQCNYEYLVKQCTEHHEKALSTDHNIFENVMYEVEQKLAKRKNVIIRGLPEHDSGSPSERNRKDMEKADNVFCLLGINNIRIVETSRLGRIIPGRSRLLKVKLQNENLRDEILKKSSTLKIY